MIDEAGNVPVMMMVMMMMAVMMDRLREGGGRYQRGHADNNRHRGEKTTHCEYSKVKSYVLNNMAMIARNPH
jgi:hypothetical protein